MSVVDDDDVMVLLQVTLQRGLGGASHAAAEVGLFTGPAEPTALTVLFGKN